MLTEVYNMPSFGFLSSVYCNLNPAFNQINLIDKCCPDCGNVIISEYYAFIWSEQFISSQSKLCFQIKNLIEKVIRLGTFTEEMLADVDDMQAFSHKC